MSAHTGDSRALVPSNSSPGFVQQGSVDWTALSRTSVNFTVDVIARLSRAGVEVLTICAARALFHNVKLDRIGEKRVLDAVKDLRAFSSYNEMLWFGFGVKHIVRDLCETQEGLACVGICACLLEQYSAEKSAEILRELFSLYKAPEELHPSLMQWHSLLRTCGGALTSTNFGLVLSQITHLRSLNPLRRTTVASSSKAIAAVLKACFDLSHGLVDSIHVTGDDDCAWIASTAHWLLGLRVEIRDETGRIIYRPGAVAASNDGCPQVILTPANSDGVFQNSMLLSRTFVLTEDATLFEPYGDRTRTVLSGGRLSWSTCLSESYGPRMKSLLGPLAHLTAAYLGNAARLGETKACCSFRLHYHGKACPYCWGSTGRAMIDHACSFFPEIQQAPGFRDGAILQLTTKAELVMRQYHASIAAIKKACSCDMCMTNVNYASNLYMYYQNRALERNLTCYYYLVHLLSWLIRLTSCLLFLREHILLPSREGLLSMHEYLSSNTLLKLQVQETDSSDEFDYWADSNLVVETDMMELLGATIRLFTGRSMKSQDLAFSAISADGICFALNSLCEVTSDFRSLASIRVMPGAINWQYRGYQYVNCPVRRSYRGHYFVEPMIGKRGLPLDVCLDATSTDLKSELIVQESLQGISARWRVRSSHVLLEICPFTLVHRALVTVDRSDISECKHNQDASSVPILDNRFIVFQNQVYAIANKDHNSFYNVRKTSHNPVVAWLAMMSSAITYGIDAVEKCVTVVSERTCINCLIEDHKHRYTPLYDNKQITSVQFVLTSS